MSVAGIQGRLLEVTVLGCNKLKDTEWISRQDPYVYLQYGSSKFGTRTCTDGGTNPEFLEKMEFTLIEGLRELNVEVWNSNTFSKDDFIGSGKVQLQKVLSQGYDDTACRLQTKSNRCAGEVKLILHYENANNAANSSASSAVVVAPPVPSAPTYVAVAPPVPQVSMYSAPPPPAYPASSPFPSYPPYSAAYPPPAPYPTPQAVYLLVQPNPSPSAFPPLTYQPPPQAWPHYPPGPYPPIYPPPPY